MAISKVLGTPTAGGILSVCDHASNRVPDKIDLGISLELLGQHIAYDIGVEGVARFLVTLSGGSAYLATHSRLVVDLNRNPNDASVIPLVSDGIVIPGNNLDRADRAARLRHYFHPYHTGLEHLLRDAPPALILSIHSFTRRLETGSLANRPWEIGILYNEHETSSLIAIDYLEGEGLIVGDQLPYSAKQLNATMNRHAEANGIPYVGVEIRQDLISDAAGQERFAAILAEMAQYIVESLASGAAT